MFTDEFWNSLFFDPDFASKVVGPLLGGIITGFITIVAALLSLYVYFSRKSRESSQDFLQWISTSSLNFQNNESYKNTRESIAEYRPQMLLYIGLELYLTSSIHLSGNDSYSKGAVENFLLTQYSNLDNIRKPNQGLPFLSFAYSNKGVDKWKYKFNWTLIRQVTDYLRFYEETLLACQTLSGLNNRKEAANLLNNYYWHLKSILLGWGDDFNNKLFIHFLIHNHLDNLSEVGLFMIGNEDKAFTTKSIKLMNRLSRENNRNTITYKKIIKKWKNIVEIPIVSSGGLMTNEILEFIKRKNAI